jgi:hypothetical protein
MSFGEPGGVDEDILFEVAKERFWILLRNIIRLGIEA